MSLYYVKKDVLRVLRSVYHSAMLILHNYNIAGDCPETAHDIDNDQRDRWRVKVLLDGFDCVPTRRRVARPESRPG